MTMVQGCSGCATTGGVLACPIHGGNHYLPNYGPVVAPDRPQRFVSWMEKVLCGVCNGSGQHPGMTVPMPCPGCQGACYQTVTKTAPASGAKSRGTEESE